MAAGFRDDLADCLARYFAAGGRVTRVEEKIITVDWARDTPLLRAARHMSQLGHRRRRKKGAVAA